MPQHDSETPHIPHYSEQQRQPDVGSHQVAQTSTGPPTYRSGKEGVEQVLEGTVHDIGRNGTGDPVVKLSDGMVVFVVYKDGQPKPQPGDTIRFRIDSHKEKFCFGKPVS
jgi:predicted RNA-binding protein with TRAM domain